MPLLISSNNPLKMGTTIIFSSISPIPPPLPDDYETMETMLSTVTELGYQNSTGTYSPNVNGVTFIDSAFATKEVGGTLWQVTSYWNSAGKLEFAIRNIPDLEWAIYPTTIGISNSDSHRNISLGIDPDGYIHVSYDHHNNSLRYRRSTLPIESFAGVLTSGLPMRGSAHESDVTYPCFFNDPLGKLYFIYRYGDTANSYLMLYKYEETTQTWNVVAGNSYGVIINGRGSSPDEGVYWWGAPAFDDNFGSGGFMHLMWCWRVVPGGNGNHDMNYLKWNGTNWYFSNGEVATLPVKQEESRTVVRSLATGSYLMNQGHMASDGSGRPHIVYQRLDSNSHTQMYHLYRNDSGTWVERQMTNTTLSLFSLNRMDIAVEKSTNVVYIIYSDPTLGPGIYVQASDPDDFTIWTTTNIHATDIGYDELVHDAYIWKTYGRINLRIAQWISGGAKGNIKVLDRRLDNL